MKYRLHIRRMRQPGIYWTWNQQQNMPYEYMVDYASRDDRDRIDHAKGINFTARNWRQVLHVLGVVVVLSWPAFYKRRT